MLMLALLAAVAAPDGKPMMADDWHTLQVVSVGQAQVGPFYLDVHAGDLDGDGLGDDAYLRLVCTGGKLQAASYAIKSPRDASTGQATGKRMHKPLTITKEWGPASPQLMAMKASYDIKKVEGTGARTMASDDWSPITLSNAGEVCTAMQATRLTKSRSNIQNN